jgi:[protein-PII] uridylyltransferase
MRPTDEHPSKTLKARKAKLVSGFLNGHEPNFLEKHSQILDDYLHASYEKSIAGPQIVKDKNPYAVIALGGYGRQEMCIHSDIDLLFLFKKGVPKAATELVKEVVYPLWDVGLDVGHATRSVDECLRIGGEDMEVLTSLLDARFVCGMSFLYSEFMERFRNQVILNKPDKYIQMLVESNQQRHEQFGDSSYLLEPNLKEGQGGLRDYHTMLWISRIRSDLKQSRDLEYFGYLSHSEFNELNNAMSFIWCVRNWLHHLVGRRYNQLHFEYQEKIAKALNFGKADGQQPVERFLGKLHENMNVLKQQHLIFLYELENMGKQRGKKKVEPQPDMPGLAVRRAMLTFDSPEMILESPQLLIQIFEESVRMKLPISVEARRLIKDFLYLADSNFRSDAEIITAFERILTEADPASNILNEMLNTGFLTRFIPQFEIIRNRIQYDEYHVYPVDRHSLRTVKTIKKFGTTDDPTHDPLNGKLYQELSDKRLLLWAAMLHDIGKGEPGGGHSEKGAKIAREILFEKGYTEAQIETVAFLIQEHLLLIKTATRRDIQDEETAVNCARKIGDPECLKMLYLLTIADSLCTGPKAWNEWTAALLRRFFLSVLNVLENGELTSRESVKNIEGKKAGVLAAADRKDSDEIKKLLEAMPPRYLLHTEAQDISEHIQLYKKLGNSAFVWDVRKNANTRQITFCAKDAPGLISKAAGVFTLNGINIFDVQVHTWLNNIALDIFEVSPPPDQILEDERWARAARDMEAALSGHLNLSDALKEKLAHYNSGMPHTLAKPDRVKVNNSSSNFFTIIEVFTYDFPGLLFKVTDALFRCKSDIWLAKIATKADQVVDVFYVRDFDGQKIESQEQVEAIISAIEAVLPGDFCRGTEHHVRN